MRPADELEARLRALGTPERAAGEKAYLKSDLEFFGTTAGQIRAEVKVLSAGLPLERRDVLGTAEELWGPRIHERRLAAVLLLSRHAPLLGAGDLPFLERLIRESGTWAYVDPLAGDIAGGIALADPVPAATVLERWAADDDFWVRRSALLAHLPALRRPASPAWAFPQFTRYADRMLDEKEFFIRKAIGWVLREDAKRRPAEVAAWLAPRTHRASGVTLREAVKYLPPAEAERLLAAYRARVPALGGA